MALVHARARRRPRPPSWISLDDRTAILFAIGLVRPGPRGLVEALVRERSLGFFAALADARAAVERQARALGLYG
jgi:hypothetical protein